MLGKCPFQTLACAIDTTGISLAASATRTICAVLLALLALAAFAVLAFLAAILSLRFLYSPRMQNTKAHPKNGVTSTRQSSKGSTRLRTFSVLFEPRGPNSQFGNDCSNFLEVVAFISDDVLGAMRSVETGSTLTGFAQLRPVKHMAKQMASLKVTLWGLFHYYPLAEWS